MFAKIFFFKKKEEKKKDFQKKHMTKESHICPADTKLE